LPRFLPRIREDISLPPTHARMASPCALTSSGRFLRDKTLSLPPGTRRLSRDDRKMRVAHVTATAQPVSVRQLNRDAPLEPYAIPSMGIGIASHATNGVAPLHFWMPPWHLGGNAATMISCWPGVPIHLVNLILHHFLSSYHEILISLQPLRHRHQCS